MDQCADTAERLHKVEVHQEHIKESIHEMQDDIKCIKKNMLDTKGFIKGATFAISTIAAAIALAGRHLWDILTGN